MVTPPPPHRPRVRGNPARGFAFDLDRTLVAPGRAPSRLARATIESARAMGLSTILVSGRDYATLTRFARAVGPLDAIVAENGAVVEAPLGGPPRVMGRGIAHQVRRRLGPMHGRALELGLIVVSSPWTDRKVMARRLSGLEIQLIRNRDRLMVVPAGVSKRSGLGLALRRLHIPEHSFAAIGDGENDIPMLRAAAVSGAVANAIPSVKSIVDYVAHEPFERGVQEFLQGPVARWTRGALGQPSAPRES